MVDTAPIPDPKSRKKFMFYDTSKRQADLRVRLRFDNMNQSEFFRAMITGYLEKDQDLLNYLDKYKQRYSIQGVNKRLDSKRLLKKGKETKKQFALDDTEIEDIFDIIEKEHPDL
jgi:hypothetical protein